MAKEILPCRKPGAEMADALVSCNTAAWRFALNVNNLTDRPCLATGLAGGDC